MKILFVVTNNCAGTNSLNCAGKELKAYIYPGTLIHRRLIKTKSIGRG